MRLDVMLRLRGASGWPRPTVAITDDAVHGWWSGWHSALLRGKHLGVTNGDSSSSSGEASSGEPTSSSPSSSTPHGKEMPDEEKEDVKGSSSSSKGGPGLCKGTSGASQLPSASIVMVVCSRPASRQAMWELRANLARAIPAAERAFDAVTSSLPEVAAGGSPVSGAQMLLVLPETHASSCYRRRAAAGSRGHNDGHTSGEHTSGSFNGTDVDGPYSASRINTDGLLTGLRLTNWGLVHVPLSNSRNLRCDRPGSSSSSLSESESGRAAAPSSLAAIFGRVVRRLKSEYALVLEARTIVAPDALCALARAAASAAAASAASAAYPKGEEASERAFCRGDSFVARSDGRGWTRCRWKVKARIALGRADEPRRYPQHIWKACPYAVRDAQAFMAGRVWWRRARPAGDARRKVRRVCLAAPRARLVVRPADRARSLCIERRADSVKREWPQQWQWERG